MPINEVTTQKIIENATKQVNSCIAFRQPRLDEIKRSEDMYLGKTKPALKGRFNIPIPIMEGFVETLMSKIDDTIKVSFKPTREATLKASKKVTSAWEHDSAPSKGAFNDADLDSKKLAIFSGFGVTSLIPQAKPYKQTLTAIDYHDFIFEPLGGRNLDKHLFKGELNVFKTKSELKKGTESGIYNKTAVEGLINAVGDDEHKRFEEQMKNKMNRFTAMGLNPEMHSYVGSDIYNLTQLITRFDGVDYYLLFEKDTGKYVRLEPLKEMFESGLSPYVAWHTSRNPVNFMCKAPVDAIRPAAEAMRILINQNFDNIQKRNWNQIMVNAKKVADLGELAWRPNGVVRLNLKDGESVNNAVGQMQTPDTSSITINLMDWFNNFIGEKSGITPATQGVADEKRVGIFLGNLRQVADRLGMVNKFYKQAHIEIGLRYKANLAQYMPPRDFMVKFIGNKGVQDESLTKEEARENLDVAVSSETAEAELDEIKQKKRTEALVLLRGDEALRQEVSNKWLAEQFLRNGEYGEEDIKFALAKEEGANAELLSEAAKAIEDIVTKGEADVKLNKGANMAFVKKIRDYAFDESDSLDDETFAKLIEYTARHFEIAQQNQLQEAQLASQGQLPQEGGQVPQNPQQVVQQATQQPQPTL